jgi:hypothetical protein
MPDYKCINCKKDDKAHFNYCRACGNHLGRGETRVRLAIARQATDKYCGNCGNPVRKCQC